MPTHEDVHRQSTAAPERPLIRDTGWAPPREDSTAARDTLPKTKTDRMLRFPTLIFPQGEFVWPVEVRGTGQVVYPDPDSTDGTRQG